MQVVCDVASRTHGWLEDTWSYNVSASTLKTEKLRSPGGSAYCLTAGSSSSSSSSSSNNNNSVYASLCASEARVDDANQRWTVEVDATIRPADKSLCLTNGNPDGVQPSTKVFLAACEPDSVLQHWAYHGCVLVCVRACVRLGVHV